MLFHIFLPCVLFFLFLKFQSFFFFNLQAFYFTGGKIETQQIKCPFSQPTRLSEKFSTMMSWFPPSHRRNHHPPFLSGFTLSNSASHASFLSNSMKAIGLKSMENGCLSLPDACTQRTTLSLSCTSL